MCSEEASAIRASCPCGDVAWEMDPPERFRLPGARESEYVFAASTAARDAIAEELPQPAEATA